MENHVWSLYFLREQDDGLDVDLLLGVYSTEERANAAKERARRLPQFKETPSDTLDVYRDDLDSSGWQSGFFHG